MFIDYHWFPYKKQTIDQQLYDKKPITVNIMLFLFYLNMCYCCRAIPLKVQGVGCSDL